MRGSFAMFTLVGSARLIKCTGHASSEKVRQISFEGIFGERAF